MKMALELVLKVTVKMLVEMEGAMRSRGKVMSIFVCLGRCILLGSECSFFVNQAPNAVFCSKMIQCSLFPNCIKST